jgi:hypothetical protein
MCLSCHRAHASGFESITRWSNTDTFITDGSGLVAQGGLSATQAKVAYYNRPMAAGGSYGFGNYQRSLCNKCHVKD